MRHALETTTQPTSERPRKPPSVPSPIGQLDAIAQENVRVVVETCWCGSSISIPVNSTGTRALLTDWRDGHNHPSAQEDQPAQQANIEVTGTDVAPAVGSFLAVPRQFGFSG